MQGTVSGEPMAKVESACLNSKYSNKFHFEA